MLICPFLCYKSDHDTGLQDTSFVGILRRCKSPKRYKGNKSSNSPGGIWEGF